MSNIIDNTQMQDKYFNLSPQCKLLPVKSTISAIKNLQCNAQYRWKAFFTIKSQSEQVR